MLHFPSSPRRQLFAQPIFCLHCLQLSRGFSLDLVLRDFFFFCYFIAAGFASCHSDLVVGLLFFSFLSGGNVRVEHDLALIFVL